MKGGRRLTMAVTKKWFAEMRQATYKDKTRGEFPMGKRMEDEFDKKAFLLYIQSWLNRAIFDKSVGRKQGERERE